MNIFAISDPHLAFATPNKTMDRFGELWQSHPQKIKLNWERFVKEEDVVILPGDISWGKKWENAKADLMWLDALPGQKIILKGNHDLWWPKSKALHENLPKSLKAVHKNSVIIGNFVFFGARLWDTSEYGFNEIIEWDLEKGKLPKDKSQEEISKQDKIYNREIERLKLSLQSIPDDAPKRRIGLCHYPPLHHSLQPSRVSKIFDQAGAEHVVFGHLHSLKKGFQLYGTLNKTEYHLTSCDYINFIPKKICGD